MHFQARLQLLNLLFQYNIFLSFICEQQSHLYCLIRKVCYFSNSLITRCNPATSCNKENSLHFVLFSIDLDQPIPFILKFPKWPVYINKVPYFQFLQVWGQFTSFWKFRVGVWPVYFNQKFDYILFGAHIDWSILSEYLLAFRVFLSGYLLNNSEMLANTQLELRTSPSQIVDVSIMVKNFFISNLKLGNNRFQRLEFRIEINNPLADHLQSRIYQFDHKKIILKSIDDYQKHFLPLFCSGTDVSTQPIYNNIYSFQLHIQIFICRNYLGGINGSRGLIKREFHTTGQAILLKIISFAQIPQCMMNTLRQDMGQCSGPKQNHSWNRLLFGIIYRTNHKFQQAQKRYLYLKKCSLKDSTLSKIKYLVNQTQYSLTLS